MLVGAGVGAAVGAVVGFAVGALVGFAVGELVGSVVGLDVGAAVGATVGVIVGAGMTAAVGFDVGDAVGDLVGAAVGGNVKPWKTELMLVEAEHVLPVGGTCACAVKLNATVAPLHKFLVNVSVIGDDDPEPSGLGDTSDTRLVEFPPTTESKNADVAPVFVTM